MNMAQDCSTALPHFIRTKTTGDEIMTTDSPTPHVLEYIIDYKSLRTSFDALNSFKDSLTSFTPVYLHHLPIASVLVSPERESSLLETLAQTKGITYRRGAPHRFFDTNEEENNE
jgi:hypothetical protein